MQKEHLVILYALGFGFDLSEFDIWWAVERKSREHAANGKIHAYMISQKQEREKSTMFLAMGVDERHVAVVNKRYEEAYLKIIDELKHRFLQELLFLRHCNKSSPLSFPAAYGTMTVSNSHKIACKRVHN